MTGDNQPVREQQTLDRSRVPVLLRQFLPAASAVEIAFGPVADHRAELREVELGAVSRAAARRVDEFSTGRMLARRAMTALGLPAEAVATSASRAPQWPDYCMGSITHATGIAGAAVCPRGALRGLGIDLELADRVGAHLYPKLFTSRELADLDTAVPQPRQGTMRFSAKEAVYKAVNPGVGQFIGFQEVEIFLPHADSGNKSEAAGVLAGSFQLRYVGAHEPNRIMEAGRGFYCFFEQYVFTLFMIP